MPRGKYDDTLDQLATRVPARLHKAVKLAAMEAEVTVRDWVADALATYLRELSGEDTEAPATPERPRKAATRA